MYDAIPGSAMVKAYRYGQTIEITDAPKSKQVIEVLPGYRYKDLRSGKIKKMRQRTQVRSDNIKSIKATMARLRRLIGANFNGGRTELWVTLTYDSLMRNTAIVYRDFKVFMQRVRQCDWGKTLEYLTVIEPQASGSWHLHVLFKRTDGKTLYVSNSEMAQLWQHGFTCTKRLRETDNVTAYLMAYLTDVAVGADKAKRPKQIAKGARLHLYPANTRIYRASRGIKKPLVQRNFKAKILADEGIDRDADKRYKRNYRHNTQEITITTEFYNINGIKKGGEGHETDA